MECSALRCCRLYRGQSHVELEWTVGPIPFEDGLGREVVLLVSCSRRPSATAADKMFMSR